MDVLTIIKNSLTGTPRFSRDGNTVRFVASHRLPSSGYELHIAVRLVGLFGAFFILVYNYRPETPADLTRNVFLEQADLVIAALANAFDRLRAVAEHRTLNVPLASLQGWGAALAWVGGLSVFRHSGLIDLYSYLTNRERITILIDDDHLSVRRGQFGLVRKVARGDIQDVLILPNHRTGHDVMVQHKGGLMRVARIYGDLTRPTLFMLRLKEALALQANAKGAGYRLLLRQLN